MQRNRIFLTPTIIATAICLSVIARPAGAGQSNAPAACAFLSQGEIEQAVGAAIGSVEHHLVIENASACRFTMGGGGLVMVVVRRPSRPDWISEQIARMAAYPQRFHEVNGIGDRSFLFDMTEKSAALCIFNADHYIQVSALGVTQPSKLLPTLVALGEKVLSRCEHEGGHGEVHNRR
jgi:hypothetical protein